MAASISSTSVSSNAARFNPDAVVSLGMMPGLIPEVITTEKGLKFLQIREL